jgi:hypothetical protein
MGQLEARLAGEDVVRNGGGGLPIRMVINQIRVLEISLVLVWLGAGCWMIRDLLCRGDAANQNNGRNKGKGEVRSCVS